MYTVDNLKNMLETTHGNTYRQILDFFRNKPERARPEFAAYIEPLAQKLLPEIRDKDFIDADIGSIAPVAGRAFAKKYADMGWAGSFYRLKFNEKYPDLAEELARLYLRDSPIAYFEYKANLVGLGDSDAVFHDISIPEEREGFKKIVEGRNYKDIIHNELYKVDIEASRPLIEEYYSNLPSRNVRLLDIKILKSYPDLLKTLVLRIAKEDPHLFVYYELGKLYPELKDEAYYNNALENPYSYFSKAIEGRTERLSEEKNVEAGRKLLKYEPSYFLQVLSTGKFEELEVLEEEAVLSLAKFDYFDYFEEKMHEKYKEYNDRPEVIEAFNKFITKLPTFYFDEKNSLRKIFPGKEEEAAKNAYDIVYKKMLTNSEYDFKNIAHLYIERKLYKYHPQEFKKLVAGAMLVNYFDILTEGTSVREIYRDVPEAFDEEARKGLLEIQDFRSFLAVEGFKHISDEESESIAIEMSRVSPKSLFNYSKEGEPTQYSTREGVIRVLKEKYNEDYQALVGRRPLADDFPEVIPDAMFSIYKEAMKGWQDATIDFNFFFRILDDYDLKISDLPGIHELIKSRLESGRQSNIVDNLFNMSDEAVSRFIDAFPELYEAAAKKITEDESERFYIKKRIKKFYPDLVFERIKNLRQEKELPEAKKMFDIVPNDIDVETPSHIKINNSIYQREQRPTDFAEEPRFTLSQNNTNPSEVLYRINKSLIHAGDGVAHTNVGASGFTAAWALFSFQPTNEAVKKNYEDMNALRNKSPETDHEIIIEQYQSDYPVVGHEFFSGGKLRDFRPLNNFIVNHVDMDKAKEVLGEDITEESLRQMAQGELLPIEISPDVKDARTHFDYISKAYPYLVIINTIEVAKKMGKEYIYILKDAPFYANTQNEKKAKYLYEDIPATVAEGEEFIGGTYDKEGHKAWKIKVSDENVKTLRAKIKKLTGKGESYDFSLTPAQNIKKQEEERKSKKNEWEPDPEKIKRLKGITESLRERFPEKDIPEFTTPQQVLRFLGQDIKKDIGKKKFNQEFGRMSGELGTLIRAWNIEEKLFKISQYIGEKIELRYKDETFELLDKLSRVLSTRGHLKLAEEVSELNQDENRKEFHKAWLVKGDNVKYYIEELTDYHLETLNSIVPGNIPPKYLSSGVEGDAWELPGKHVLKIYKDRMGGVGERKYRSSKEIMYKSEEFGGNELMIFGDGAFEHAPFKWVIMEKFDTLKSFRKNLYDMTGDDNVNKVFEEVRLSLQGIINMIEIASYKNLKVSKLMNSGGSYHISPQEFLKNTDLIKEVHPEIARQVSENISNVDLDLIKDNMKLDDDWFNDLVYQVLTRTVMGMRDFGVYNIGVRPSTGKLIFFDA